MVTIHLNPAQRDFIQKWINENKSRPLAGPYCKAAREISRIAKSRKPSLKSISNTKFSEANNFKGVVPDHKKFDAIKDLPPGWAISCCWDSGGNYSLGDAGEAMLAALWNYWASATHSGIPLKLLSALPTHQSGLIRDNVKANNLEIPSE